MKKGQAVAVAFPLEKTGWKHPNSYQNQKFSSEKESWTGSAYKNRGLYHAGMMKKPLEPYNPNAMRSRLPQPTIVMPYKNSSQIVIGDRTQDERKQWKTINKLMMVQPDLTKAVTNGGIIA